MMTSKLKTAGISTNKLDSLKLLLIGHSVNTGHVTHQGKQNWPIGGWAIVHMHPYLDDIINDIM